MLHIRTRKAPNSPALIVFADSGSQPYSHTPPLLLPHLSSSPAQPQLRSPSLTVDPWNLIFEINYGQLLEEMWLPISCVPWRQVLTAVWLWTEVFQIFPVQHQEILQAFLPHVGARKKF